MASGSQTAPSQGPGEETSSTPHNDAIPGILPASHWLQPEYDDSDAESTRGSIAGSTQSLSESIYEYREVLGRTLPHEIAGAEGWNLNDARHSEAMDLYHAWITLVNGGKLHFAPIPENIQKALDVGTGTGIWACEFGEQYPSCEVTGIDLSPMQPSFVPPNVKFEIDNIEQEWTWPDDTFDYIHLRAMIGSIKDWDRLYRQAYRCLKPGGWIESRENSVRWKCENNSITDDSAVGQYHKVVWRAGELMGQTFKIVDDDIHLQREVMERAGFVNTDSRDMKGYYGSWPTDRRDKLTGNMGKLCFEEDPEGWVIYLWNMVLGWSHDEIRVFLAHLLKQLNSERTKAYLDHRAVWAQKPLRS